MATYQCKVCGGTYLDPQIDGSRYFHVCPPLRNPAYDAQFTTDDKGNQVAKGKIDATIPRTLPRPDARNENLERKPDGTIAPKESGKGRDTL